MVSYLRHLFILTDNLNVQANDSNIPRLFFNEVKICL